MLDVERREAWSARPGASCFPAHRTSRREEPLWRPQRTSGTPRWSWPSGGKKLTLRSERSSRVAATIASHSFALVRRSPRMRTVLGTALRVAPSSYSTSRLSEGAGRRPTREARNIGKRGTRQGPAVTIFSDLLRDDRERPDSRPSRRPGPWHQRPVASGVRIHVCVQLCVNSFFSRP
jgi:hypothetical protein